MRSGWGTARREERGAGKGREGGRKERGKDLQAQMHEACGRGPFLLTMCSWETFAEECHICGCGTSTAPPEQLPPLGQGRQKSAGVVGS
jgi:hypothetical protein